MSVQPREKGIYAFGPFWLDPTRRIVADAGGEVALTPRLFDTLLYLVQNSERLVERDELAFAVWADRAVSEGNLQKAISSLRKVLQAHAPGQTFILTVPARGFRFAVQVTWDPGGASVTGPLEPAAAIDDAQAPVWWNGGRVFALVMPAVLLAAFAAGFWLNPPRGSGASVPFDPPPHSVAVMAFTNLSGDPRQEYFSDGLSEELINALGRIGTLRVAARLSSFSFKGKTITIGAIARQLNVGTVLEGSVRREGSRLRITAHLIDARTGFQLWSRDFDREQGDVFNIQGDIAEALATSLRVTLLGDDRTRLAQGNTTDPRALDAYLRGMTLRNALTPESLHEALAAFDQAVLVDPGFALAHVARAATLINFIEGAGGTSDDTAAVKRYRAQSLAEAERAVSLAPQLGAAHSVLGAAHEELWDFADAEAEYVRARELAPGDAIVERRYARFEAAMGHGASALAAAEHAVQLDPLSIGVYLGLASSLTLARRPEDASDALRHAEHLGFRGLRDTDQRAQVALLKRDYAQVRKICAGEQDWVQDYYLAIAARALGDAPAAQAALAKFQVLDGNNSPFQYAAVYAQWGDPKNALRWLETAFRERDDGLIDMKIYWLLDPIRNTAGYKDIERRINFPR